VIQAHGEAGLDPDYMVTCGPFRIESWQRGERVILTRYPEYYGRFSGNVERVEITLLSVEDWPRSIEMYNAEALDLMDPSPLPSPILFSEVHRHVSEAIVLPPTGTLYCGFRADRPPFDDVRVRRAFALATDPRELFRVSSLMRPATGGFLPAGMPGHSPGLNLPYDPRSARELLAQAGYPNGLGLPPLRVLLPTDPISLDFYQVMQQKQWVEGLGVELTWDLLKWSEYLERLASDPPDIFGAYWTAHYHDPDSFLRAGFPWKATRWRSKTYSQLVEESGRATEPVRRIALFRQADKLLIEEAVIVPLEYGSLALLIKPWVKRFPTAPPYRAWMLQDVVVERA
jgi:oligopeptide transport system substrate-binding protein